MSMIETYRNIVRRVGADNQSVIEGEVFVLLEDAENDYNKDRLAVIPAGTSIIADFAGDFGMYGMAEVDGMLNKIKLRIEELHKVDFGTFDARKRAAA